MSFLSVFHLPRLICWECRTIVADSASASADFFEHLNDLNVKLQGSGKVLYVTFCHTSAFKRKL